MIQHFEDFQSIRQQNFFQYCCNSVHHINSHLPSTPICQSHAFKQYRQKIDSIWLKFLLYWKNQWNQTLQNLSVCPAIIWRNDVQDWIRHIINHINKWFIRHILYQLSKTQGSSSLDILVSLFKTAKYMLEEHVNQLLNLFFSLNVLKNMMN